MHITTAAPNAPAVLRWLLLCFTLITAGCATRGAAERAPAPPSLPERDSVRLLAVGNSFSDNAMSYLPKLAEAGGKQLTMDRASIGGGSIQQHWQKVEKFQANPEDPAAKHRNGKTLHQLLTQEPWDYVTMQQFSWLSHDPSTHEPWATQLASYIREHAPTAELLVHQIWAYRVDDPRFDPNHKSYGQPAGGPKSYDEMYERLTAAYDELAERLEARVIPVGDAFFRADRDETWGFAAPPTPVDPTAYQHPNLPEQEHSLHTGWHWAKQKDETFKLQYDGHHAGVAGRYLAGCVWYEFLFNDSVVDNTFVPDELDAEYAAFLRKVAHEAVAARAATHVTAANR